jgi:hypothetical protein
MSKFENKELSGALFANERKDPGTKQPDYSGTAKIEGVDYRISGWKKQAKSGKVYLSLSFQEDNDDWKSKSSAPIDDSIPF